MQKNRSQALCKSFDFIMSAAMAMALIGCHQTANHIKNTQLSKMIPDASLDCGQVAVEVPAENTVATEDAAKDANTSCSIEFQSLYNERNKTLSLYEAKTKALKNIERFSNEHAYYVSEIKNWNKMEAERGPIDMYRMNKQLITLHRKSRIRTQTEECLSDILDRMKKLSAEKKKIEEITNMRMELEQNKQTALQKLLKEQIILQAINSKIKKG